MSNAATRAETRIQTIEGGITAPAGFKAAGVYAGIKPPTHAWPLDVMLMTADRPVSAAAVFTTNKTQAAPVLVSRANLEKSGGRAKAIVCNSGCANACTGDAGMDVTRARRSNSSPAMSDAAPKKYSSPRPASSASISACRRCRTVSRKRSPR